MSKLLCPVMAPFSKARGRQKYNARPASGDARSLCRRAGGIPAGIPLPRASPKIMRIAVIIACSIYIHQLAGEPVRENAVSKPMAVGMTLTPRQHRVPSMSWRHQTHHQLS